MGDLVPDGACWDEPRNCEELDAHDGPFPYCACPMPECEGYCGACPIVY